MNPDKLRNQETSDSRNSHPGTSMNPSQSGISPSDPPPSYSEAIRNPPFQDVNYSTQTPSAPVLEANSTNFNSNNAYAAAQLPQSGQPYNNFQNQEQFKNWDDTATRILITNRLRMNDQFYAANSQRERDLLWNSILDDLLIHGYIFNVYDLIQFWEFQLYIYKSIIDNIRSSDSWVYYEPMHNIFGGHIHSLGTTTSSTIDVVPSVLPTPTVPITTNQPIPESNNVQHSEAPSVTNLDTSSSINATSIDNNQTITELPNSGTSAILNNASSSERTPLLTVNNEDVTLQSDVLLKSSPNVVDSSGVNPISESAVHTSTISEVAAKSDLATIQGSIPPADTTTNLITDISSHSPAVITSQPEGFSIPKFLDDNTITVQPGLSPNLPVNVAPAPVTTNVGHPDDCCLICWPHNCCPMSDCCHDSHQHDGCCDCNCHLNMDCCCCQCEDCNCDCDCGNCDLGGCDAGGCDAGGFDCAGCC